MTVQVFKCFEFLDEGFILVLQNGHSVLQTLDVLLLLPATLPSGLPGNTDETSRGHGSEGTRVRRGRGGAE